MKRGDKVRGIDLGDGCPVKGGETYTVKSAFKDGSRVAGDGSGVNKGRPGVTLVELSGHFLQDRLEVIE